MLSAWSASFLTGMTRISREMNHRACREKRRILLPAMRRRLLPSRPLRHSRFTLANRITSLLPTIQILGPFGVFESMNVFLRRPRNFARFCFRCKQRVGPTRNDLSNAVLLPGIHVIGDLNHDCVYATGTGVLTLD
jgi:hypothetical protein